MCISVIQLRLTKIRWEFKYKMSHIFTSGREIKRDDNLPIKNMITFKLKIKFLFKITKKCTATQHQPSFLETFPLVLTNPTGCNFPSTRYQLRGVSEFFHKEIKIRLRSLRVGWPPRLHHLGPESLRDGWETKEMLECDWRPAGRQGCSPSSAAETCASHRRSELSRQSPTCDCLQHLPGVSQHLYTFCLATQYLFQGRGRKYYFSKRKKKKLQDLKPGSPHRARCCPATLVFFFFKDEAARSSKWSHCLGSQHWSWTESLLQGPPHHGGQAPQPTTHLCSLFSDHHRWSQRDRG